MVTFCLVELPVLIECWLWCSPDRNLVYNFLMQLLVVKWLLKQVYVHVYVCLLTVSLVQL